MIDRGEFFITLYEPKGQDVVSVLSATPILSSQSQSQHQYQHQQYYG